MNTRNDLFYTYGVIKYSFHVDVQVDRQVLYE